MLFADLGLAEPILSAIVTEGYAAASPVQAEAIPHVIAGRDLLASAQTGTGKTAAFALPILHRFALKPSSSTHRKIRCLVLCPTRELATQISESFRAYGRNLPIRNTVIYGGANQNPQVASLRRGVDVLVATPGRLLDLMEQGHVDLSALEVLVLDEADRMMDMGFIHDVKKIVVKTPKERQTLFFSATMPHEIKALATSILKTPAIVQIAQVKANADGIEQSVYFVEQRNKPALLAHLVDFLPMTRTIVFTRTKHGADRVVRALHARGIPAEAIHGNKTQNNRERALKNFRNNKIPVLVATDIASRGIDVDGITHVVNYDITHEPETYVHRIGRTARAGATGAVVAFCNPDERGNLKAIERLLKHAIPVKTDQPEYVGENAPTPRGDSDRNDRNDRHERSDRGDRHDRPERGGRSHQPSSRTAPSHASHAPRSHHAPAAHHAAARPAAHAAARPAHAPAAKPHAPHGAPRTPVVHRKGITSPGQHAAHRTARPHQANQGKPASRDRGRR